MSHLPQVEFAPDAPEALECITALAKCIVAGDIVDCASEDPGNMIRLVGRVASEGADRFLSPVDPDQPLIGDNLEELEAWETLARSLEVQQVANDGAPTAREKAFPWQLVITLALEALKRWLDSRD